MHWHLRYVLAGLIVALAIGTLVVVWTPADPVQAARPVTLSVEGLAVDPGMDVDIAARALATQFLRTEIRLRIDANDVRTYTRSGIGARVDLEHLQGLIAHARDARSAMRLAYEHTGRSQLDLPLPVAFESSALMTWLLELKDELDRPPVDARMNTQTREIIPEQNGRRVDVWETLDRVDAAIRGGHSEVELAIRNLPPARTAASFTNVEMRTILGEFETRYSEAHDARNRTHNLIVAGGHIDGVVLQPGEDFDFNAVVGERNGANGFRPAPVIEGGELVDGIGGGACQVAGTLHGAAFFAGLPILERNPHSRPSSYIKLGLDAAVSWPNKNLRFRNDLSAPIVLEFRVEDGFVRARVWGQARDRMVSFVRRIDGYSTYEEREEEDSDLPAGIQVLSQRGVPGFTVRRFRIVRDVESNQAIRYDSIDRYPPTTQIWRIGSGEPAPTGYDSPEGDGHPEYRADEYLSMTQGPGIEGTLEQRRAGASGQPGWTSREGMPSADRE